MISTRDKKMEETYYVPLSSPPNSGHSTHGLQTLAGLPEDRGCLQILSKQGMIQLSSAHVYTTMYFKYLLIATVINMHI